MRILLVIFLISFLSAFVQKAYTMDINDSEAVFITVEDIFSVMKFKEDYAPILLKNKFGFIDKQGNIVIKPKYNLVHNFSEGIASVSTGIIKVSPYPDSDETINIPSKFIYINKEGKQIFNDDFDLAYSFDNGIAQVTKSRNNKEIESYIDNDGNIISVTEGSYGQYYIDKNGNTLFKLLDNIFASYEFKEDLSYIFKNNTFGFINREGKIVIKIQFSFSKNFSEGLSSTSIKHTFGYINKKGDFEIEPKYFWANDFSEGLAAVVINENYGYVNENNEFIIFSEKNDLKRSQEAIKKIGYIDKAGKFVIQPKFKIGEDYYLEEAIGKFKEGLTFVPIKNKYGYINKKGETVIEAIYDNAKDFSEGLAVVGKNNKFGFIDKTGREVIPIEFDYANSFSENYAFIIKGNLQGYIDKNGKYLWKHKL